MYLEIRDIGTDRIFEGKYGKIPVPLCPGALDDIQSGAR